MQSTYMKGVVQKGHFGYKMLSFILSIALVIAFVPALGLGQVKTASAAEASGPAVDCSGNISLPGHTNNPVPSDLLIDNYEVYSVTFVNHTNMPSSKAVYWDASNAGDGSVQGWAVKHDGTSYYDVYYGCNGSYPSLPAKSYNLFAGFTHMTVINNLDKVDTSNVTEMAGMFERCNALTELNLSNFKTSKVVTMYNMFKECSSLKSLDLSSFDTSKVVNMEEMFEYCTNLESLDLSSFDTSNASYMKDLFDSCYKMSQIKLGAKFSFFGTESERQVSFPEPYGLEKANYKLTGKWQNANTKEAFYPALIPNKTAATYVTHYEFNGTINMNKAKISLAATKYTYDGKAKLPAVTVSFEGNKLYLGSDYMLKYSAGRKNVGTYTVTITGAGKCTGKVVKSFVINPKGVSLKKVSAAKKSLKLKWGKGKSACTTGYKIQIATNSKFTKGKKSYTVKGYKATSKTLKSLKKGKKYYVKICTYKKVGSKTYYSSWSKVLSKKTK